LVTLYDPFILIDGTAGSTSGSVGLVTGLTGINFSNPVPYGLVVGVTFSVSDASAAANMYQFSVNNQ
jgi:hypothetical protein